MAKLKRITISNDASGAYYAARENMLVMIVDVIDMSTTLESALDGQAYAVLGSSPDYTRAPVQVSPENIGKEAVRLSKEIGEDIIIIAEPRVGDKSDRLKRCKKLITAIEKEKGNISDVLPNIGAEVAKMTDFKDKVVVAVTDTGGVAFDAAYLQRKRVITGTVARTFKQKGVQPAVTAVNRALSTINEEDNGVAIIAASRNSMEDVLAAQFIYNLLLKEN
ncbi:hypothetical protein SYNTR_0393 [Candidatus Syntrophocurvum alkaliphilum]|uniref:2-phosphosulfolactate phosphatase n=1 Tax=Candidatus Syntrophocurvum alkaliphilum TaxID=2293317 RepID=A0A6I6D721_9FIRM|nr:hypothetical protein [Candidatus Syntrophocurvum alkaliphilum]QGT98986.1 hypothetical protein SYNTR_0393 [Candidatus Syntrophocurvum alkaliphilum]